MSSDPLKPGTQVVVRRLTCSSELREARPVILFGAAVVMTSAAAGAFSPVLIPLMLGLGLPPPFILLFALLLGLAFGAAVAVFMRSSERTLSRTVKSAEQLESRVLQGKSESLLEDLGQLVDLNLKLKRNPVADFYSQKALELAVAGTERKSYVPSRIESTLCFVSTPQYHRNWRYFWFWLFESKGTLYLTDEFFEYCGTKISLRVRLNDITSIEKGQHPLWLKPIPLKFLCITFMEDGMRHRFYFSPASGICDTVWDINAKVTEWEAKLNKARRRWLPE